MEEEKQQANQNEKKSKLPLGIRIIANASIIIFGIISFIQIYWTINAIMHHGYSNYPIYYIIASLIAFSLSIFMRKGRKFANYVLGALFIYMGYDTFHISDDNPGLLYNIGYASIIIGCLFLLARIIFKPPKEAKK